MIEKNILKRTLCQRNIKVNMKLIKNTENISKEKITLFCLPFAGGGASAYNQWAKKMQGKVTVCPVQLPGREEQIMEKPYIDMSVMLDDLEEAVRKVVYGPYALWGHSMGGKIAYELEKRWEAAGYTAKCLFISGSRVPSIPEPNPIYHLPDEEFKRELGRFEGTPKEVLENQELLDFFLPMLRAECCIRLSLHLAEKRTEKRMRVRSWNGESIRTMILTTGYFREDIFICGIVKTK